MTITFGESKCFNHPSSAKVSIMARTFLFSLIWFSTFHLFNSWQRSDWFYNPATNLVTFVTSGTVYSCAAWDIIGPWEAREFNATNDSCLCGSAKSALDSSCGPSKFFLSKNESAARMNQTSSCNAPVPTTEETLDRIDRAYRLSFSYTDLPMWEWYDQVLQNLTQLQEVCSQNETRLYLMSKANGIREMALTTYTLSQTKLPSERVNATSIEIDLRETLHDEPEVNLGSIIPTFDSEPQARERMFVLELVALDDSLQRDHIFWYLLAMERTAFVRTLSRNMRIEDSVTAGGRKVSRLKKRLELLYKMALANEIITKMDYIKTHVEAGMKQVCIAGDGFDGTDDSSE